MGECVRVALHRPLDLTTDPPLRVVIRPSAEATEVALAIHHIAADGWSLRVLADDLNLAYMARVMGTEPDWQPLPVRYADHMLARAVKHAGSAADPHPNSPDTRALAGGTGGCAHGVRSYPDAPAALPKHTGLRWIRLCSPVSTVSRCGTTPPGSPSCTPPSP